MRSLPKSFLPILITSVLLLSGNARPQELSHPDRTERKNPATGEQIATPNPTTTNVRQEKKEGDNKTEEITQETVRIVVPAITTKKEFIDYAAPIVAAVFTLALVVVGAIQICALRTTNRIAIQTNKIYNAQKILQRQQTILAHRPRIKVREVHLVGQLAIDKPIKVSLSLANYGETQATIEQSNFTVDLWDQASTPYKELVDDGFGSLPEPYDGEHRYFESQMSGTPTIAAGLLTPPIRKQRRLSLQPHEWQQFSRNEKTVYVFGYIFYKNDAGQHHRTGFCYRYDKPKRRFYPVDPPDPDLQYEY